MGKSKTENTDGKEQITKLVTEIEKRQNQEQEQKRVNEIKADLARLRQEGRLVEMSEKSKKLYSYNEKGEPHSVWDDVKQRAQHVISTDFNSTMNWLSSMVNLLNMLSYLTKAISGSMDVNIYTPLKVALVDGLVLGVIKDNIFVRPSDEFRLPNLKYDIKYDDAQGLKVAPLMPNPKNDQLRGMANKLFAKGIESYLDESGYKKDPADPKKWVNKASNAPLTSAEFAPILESFKGYIARTEPNINITPSSEPPAPAPAL